MQQGGGPLLTREALRPAGTASAENEGEHESPGGGRRESLNRPRRHGSEEEDRADRGEGGGCKGGLRRRLEEGTNKAGMAAASQPQGLKGPVSKADDGKCQEGGTTGRPKQKGRNVAPERGRWHKRAARGELEDQTAGKACRVGGRKGHRQLQASAQGRR